MEDSLIEEIVSQLDQDSVVYDGNEWWVSPTADPYEIILEEFDGHIETGRRFRARISVELTAL